MLQRDGLPWVWPIAARGFLAAVAIAAALVLKFESHAVSQSPGARGVGAPELVVDPNTAPPGVLETLPHVGRTLVRQLVAAREVRPLSSLDDARSRVRGLGPATLAQIAPYLRFATTPQLRLDGNGNPVVDPPTAKPLPSRRKNTRARTKRVAPLQPWLVSRSETPDVL
jgi:hypothetical protein